MHRRLRLSSWLTVLLWYGVFLMANSVAHADPIIIDHSCTDITLIPQSAIEQAKSNLHIAYGHTSHGSQLTTGMTGLVGFANGGGLNLSLPNNIFLWNNGGTGGALDLHDSAMGGDVGYYPQWVNNTREYLDNPGNADVNVIIWSWCGQVDEKYRAGTLESEYLLPMTQLEADYPDVTFVYMTGHANIFSDGDTKAGNQIIRDYCIANDKVLYDFNDIEHYDPDGTRYEFVHDNCNYYSAPGGVDVLGNWATEWQDAHLEGEDWYTCTSAHSLPLNANRKAYAAWWLWATLAGWNYSGENRAPVLTAIGDKAVEWGQTLSLTLSANDLDSGDTLTFSASPLPDTAALDSSTGVFSWTPTEGDEGELSITFTVVDNGSPQGSDSETIAITVYSPDSDENRDPILDPVGDRQVAYGTELSIALSASDLDTEDTLTFSASQMPDGADLVVDTGLFTWTPSIDDVGEYSITFMVVDNGSPQGSDEEMVTITVTGTSDEDQEDGETGDTGSPGCFIYALLK